MPPSLCESCGQTRAVIVRPKDQQRLCKTCFIDVFEQETHETIISNNLFQRNERVAIGASGGKDSTVLASVLKTLNERYDYGIDLLLLSVDEGIKGYRDDSLETVKRNAVQYDMPLIIVGYDELYGWTMDQVVAQVGKKGNCTYCGVFRRQALDRGAAKLGINHVVTGHNADDVAETVMMNLLRGDLPRLARGTSIMTSSSASDIKRTKPLKYAYEKEIVMYAHHKKLDYFSTECVYSPEAFRGSARALIKDLEKIRPSSILDIVRSGEEMARMVPSESISAVENDDVNGCAGKVVFSSRNGMADGTMTGNHGRLPDVEMDGRLGTDHQQLPIDNRSRKTNELIDPIQHRINGRHDKHSKRIKAVKQTMGQCERCGYISSQRICKACLLLEGLNQARPKTMISTTLTAEENGTHLVRRMQDVGITDEETIPDTNGG